MRKSFAVAPLKIGVSGAQIGKAKAPKRKFAAADVRETAHDQRAVPAAFGEQLRGVLRGRIRILAAAIDNNDRWIDAFRDQEVMHNLGFEKRSGTGSAAAHDVARCALAI